MAIREQLGMQTGHQELAGALLDNFKETSASRNPVQAFFDTVVSPNDPYAVLYLDRELLSEDDEQITTAPVQNLFSFIGSRNLPDHVLEFILMIGGDASNEDTWAGAKIVTLAIANEKYGPRHSTGRFFTYDKDNEGTR